MSDDLTITLAEKLQDSSLQELFEDYRSNMVEQSFIEVGDGLNDIIEELEEDEDGTIEPRQIELLRVSIGEAMHWLSELDSDLRELEQQTKLRVIK